MGLAFGYLNWLSWIFSINFWLVNLPPTPPFVQVFFPPVLTIRTYLVDGFNPVWKIWVKTDSSSPKRGVKQKRKHMEATNQHARYSQLSQLKAQSLHEWPNCKRSTSRPDGRRNQHLLPWIPSQRTENANSLPGGAWLGWNHPLRKQGCWIAGLIKGKQCLL